MDILSTFIIIYKEIDSIAGSDNRILTVKDILKLEYAEKVLQNLCDFIHQHGQ
jgi:hypothetical protein